MMDGLLVFDDDGHVVCKKSPFLWFEPPVSSSGADAIFAVAVPNLYRFSPDLAQIEWSIKVPKLRKVAPVAVENGGVAVLAKHGQIVWLNAEGQEVGTSETRERVHGPIVNVGSGIVGASQKGGIWLFKPNQMPIELARSQGAFLAGVAHGSRKNQVIATTSQGRIYLVSIGDKE